MGLEDKIGFLAQLGANFPKFFDATFGSVLDRVEQIAGIVLFIFICSFFLVCIINSFISFLTPFFFLLYLLFLMYFTLDITTVMDDCELLENNQTEGATHVVLGNKKKTLKVLYGIAKGKEKERRKTIKKI